MDECKKAVELGFADGILFDEKKSEADKEEEPDEPEEDEPDKEGGDNEGNDDEKKPDKEKKPFKLDSGDALWQYSTRIMGQTILGKISASCKNPDENNSADNTPESSEKGLTPVIGMDGKTKDGAMPYEILRKQLSFLK